MRKSWSCGSAVWLERSATTTTWPSWLERDSKTFPSNQPGSIASRMRASSRGCRRGCRGRCQTGGWRVHERLHSRHQTIINVVLWSGMLQLAARRRLAHRPPVPAIRASKTHLHCARLACEIDRFSDSVAFRTAIGTGSFFHGGKMESVREHPRLASARIARQTMAPANATAIDCITRYPPGVARKARMPYLQQQSSLHPSGQQQPSLQHSQQHAAATFGA